jgi:hypothetical protein
MRKVLFTILLVAVAVISNAADRNLTISTGYTMHNPVSLNASDTIDVSDTVTFTITNLQKYFQHQTFTVGLTTVSGSPSVVITAYGKVTSSGAWVAIGSAITWTTTANDGSITSTTPANYNYLKVEFISSAAAQKSKITTFETKTANMYDIPASSGTLTISRATEGTVTIQTADNNANAAAVYRAGGTGALTIGATTGTTAITSSGVITIPDDNVLSLGTTATNAETKLTLEFDETTTGIGSFRLGDMSNPQVLKVNPGATVAGSIININHTLGSGDCDDLLGSYSKVNVIGSGDAGITVVGDAPRAYVGLTGGANNSVASQAYASQPWFRHGGTGAITAGSALSAKCDVGAENFTASTINAIHAHITGTSTVTGQFDGAMIEVYPDVTSLDNGLKIASDAGATVTTGIGLSGIFGNDITTSSGAKIFSGSAANGNAVYAEVGTKDATGSIYISTVGAIFIQVANAGAATDWYKVTATDAD